MHSAACTGDVVYDRTDVYFESFFIKKYSSNFQEDVDFSVYFNFDRVCVLAPKAHKVPKWLRIYHFFPLSIWIGTTLTHIVMCVTWYFLQTFASERCVQAIRFQTPLVLQILCLLFDLMKAGRATMRAA